ncbi:MAG: hypothetical protein RLO38_14905, partial [Roseovarius confluentis]
MEAARDVDDLNAAPPEAPIFAKLVHRLTEIQLANLNTPKEHLATQALARTARLMGRQKDAVAERASARIVDLSPDSSDALYGF